MLQINVFLLATFAKNIRFGPDVASSLRRYQTLATLYLYLACFTKVLCFELAIWILFPEPCPPQVIYIAAVFSLVGLLFLREGKKELAVISLLSYLHIGSYKVAFAFEQPIAALYCLFPILQAGFFTTSSFTVRLTNTLACFFQAYNHISKLLEISQSSPSLAIFRQVTTVIISSSCSIALIAASCAVQRFIESSLVNVAESNYTRSENLTKEIVTAFEAQEKVLFSLSHEIRNPLTSMVGSIDYLLSSLKGSEELKILRNAKLSSEVLLNLLSNILDAAKLKSDKVEICNRKTDIQEVIHKVFTINSERLKSSGIFARASIDSNVPKHLWVDPSRLLQILINLVTNALKFTPSSGSINIYVTWHQSGFDKNELFKSFHLGDAMEKETAPAVTNSRKFNSISSAMIRRMDSCYLNSSFSREFSLQEEKVKNKNFKALNQYKTKCFSNINTSESSHNESWAINRESLNSIEDTPSGSNLSRNGVLKVEVVDTGCGVSPTDLSKLFQMFSQGTAGTSVQKGTGLGLWLCKQLCQAMGGDITVRSELGQGTSFLFYIPINNDQLLTQSQPQRNPRTGAIKALVVDDYSFNRDLHKLLLEREGVQVTLASDGKEALEKFKAKGQDYFDFVFTDIQMPEMDGFTSAKKMREWEEEHNEQKVDIYFVSGEYFNEDAVMSEFKTMGNPNQTGICCLRKPVDVERLRKIVQK